MFTILLITINKIKVVMLQYYTTCNLYCMRLESVKINKPAFAKRTKRIEKTPKVFFEVRLK